MFMLDTNICSYILKNRPTYVLEKFESLLPEDLCISIITYAELYYGIEKSQSKKINEQVIDTFISLVTVFPWEQSAAKFYAKVRNELQKKGQMIGNMDLMIASHALSLNAIIVTNNVSEFKRIKRLKIENWIKS